MESADPSSRRSCRSAVGRGRLLDEPVHRIAAKLKAIIATARLSPSEPLVVAQLAYGPTAVPYTDALAMRQVVKEAKGYGLKPEAMKLLLIEGSLYSVPSWSPPTAK